jgi:two-component system, OmpR family, response regulator CpxR
MPKLLLVDDDREMTAMLREYLALEGFTVEVASTGVEGLDRARVGDVALVVLDVMLPGLSGFEVLRAIRTQSDLPVLMLTGRGEVVDRVVGLQIGADDYLPKPFVPQELVARIQAILRRAHHQPATHTNGHAPSKIPAVIEVGDVRMDLHAHTVRKNNTLVELTSAEFSLLRLLLTYHGQVVTREELYREVLGREYTAYDRSLDNHVSSVRRKLGLTRDGTERIRALRNSGYMYCVPAVEVAVTAVEK